MQSLDGDNRTCQNCVRLIGRLEKHGLFRGHVVCLPCHGLLLKQNRVETLTSDDVVDDPPSPPTPLDELAAARSVRSRQPTPRPAPTVWRNLKWLGLILFAAGAILEFNGAASCGYVGLFGLLLWLVAGVASISRR